MDVVLCVYLTKTSIHTLLIEKSKASSDFEIRNKRCIPLSSICISNETKRDYIFGLDISGISELIKAGTNLSEPSDFMHIPISSDLSFTLQEKIPLYYLLSDIKQKYSKWSSCSLSHLLFVCSVDVFISYSLIIEDIGKQCGFTSCKVVDDNSLLVQHLYLSKQLPLSRGPFISIQSNEHTFIVSLVSLSSSMDSSFIHEEMDVLSCSSIQQALSLDANTMHELLFYATTPGQISSSTLLSYYESHQSEIQQRILSLLQQQNTSLSSVSGILLQGSFVPPSLCFLFASLYPTLPLFTFPHQQPVWSEACLQIGSFILNQGAKREVEYIGEEVEGRRNGFGEEFHYGVCVYRGFWKEDRHHGFGEHFSEEGELLYRGEFQEDRYEGMGILYLNENEILKGEFHQGCIVDGVHRSVYANSQICYEGGYKRGMRNGVGKEFNEEGVCVYEGCFLDNQRYGNGILYTSRGSLEGSFVEGLLHGEVKEYSKNHILLSVTSYDHGVQCNEGSFYTEDGYLLYQGGVLNNQYYSHGILYYPGGHIQYDGEFLNGLFNGYGQLYNEQGDLVYIGEFKRGLRDGHGKEYTSNMFLKYVGYYENDKQHGHGKIFFSEGHYYQGSFLNGVVTGKGKMVWSDGRYYDGEFVNGKKEGRGLYSWSNNQMYDGEWKDDRREGKGIQYDSNHNMIYDGDWVNDTPSGKGTIFYTNGGYYVGEVVNYQREGKGIQYNASGCVEYDGEWRGDRPHGYGTFNYDDKCMYEGQWENGERNGLGRFVYANGTYFMGHFKNGYRCGKGYLLNAQGKIIREEVYETNSDVE